jgi:hypothetical protein
MEHQALIDTLLKRLQEVNEAKQQRIAKLIIEDGVLRSYDGSLLEITKMLDFLGVDVNAIDFTKE